MIYLQGATCFLLWIGYGFMQGRRSQFVRNWAQSTERTRRGLLAAALMLGSMLPVFVVLNLALQYNGFGKNGMSALVWLGVAVFGLVFVHGQTLATALLVTNAYEAVTAERLEASSNHGTHEKDHDKAPSP